MQKEDTALMDCASGVPDSWEKANSDFHSAIVSACGSRWLLWTRSHLHELCERYRRASVSLEAGSRGLGAEHSAIADAAIDRDAERVCELTERHFERTAMMFERATKP
jgi:DNA-binding GntR family transcriptional regulator